MTDLMDSNREPRPGVGAIEQFLLVAKTVKGAAAVELIKQVLETPGIYVFGELLDMPNVKELESNPQLESYWRLLNIFAYGTYKTYLSNQAQLPPLTPAMLNKLRHLTIVSLATQSKFIPYNTLLTELDMKNLRELEDLVIEVVYANVVQGKMDQQKNRLEIEVTIGRDIKEEDLKVVSRVLGDWTRNCDNVLRNVEQQVSNANNCKEEWNKVKQQIEAQVNNIKKTIKTQDLDDPMGSDLVNSSPREHRADIMAEKMSKRNFKSKGLRGSGSSKFWRKD